LYHKIVSEIIICESSTNSNWWYNRWNVCRM